MLLVASCSLLGPGIQLVTHQFPLHSQMTSFFMIYHSALSIHAPSMLSVTHASQIVMNVSAVDTLDGVDFLVRVVIDFSVVVSDDLNMFAHLSQHRTFIMDQRHKLQSLPPSAVCEINSISFTCQFFA